MTKQESIFSSTGCVSSEMLKAYVGRTLSAAQIREVEKHLVDCPMCSDELEGLQEFSSPEHTELVVKELNHQLRSKFGGKRRKLSLTTYVSGVAAAILVVFISGYLILKSINSMQDRKIAQEVELDEKSDKAPVTEQEFADMHDELKEETEEKRSKKGESITKAEVKLPEKKNDEEALTGSGETVAMKKLESISEVRKEEALTDDRQETRALSIVQAEEETEDDELFEGVVADASEEITISTTENDKGSRKVTIAADEAVFDSEAEVIVEEMAIETTQGAAKKEVGGRLFQKSEKGKQQAEIQMEASPAMGATSSTPDFYNMGKFAFENKDYLNANNFFEAAISNKIFNDSTFYFYAVSCYNLNKFDSTIVYLNRMQNPDIFKEERKWFLANAFVGKDSVKKAIPILNELIDPSNKYSGKAREKLKEITDDK